MSKRKAQPSTDMPPLVVIGATQDGIIPEGAEITTGDTQFVPEEPSSEGCGVYKIELDMPPTKSQIQKAMGVQTQTLDSTPMGLLQRAVDRGADLATIEKLMDLNDRHEATQARKAFVAAMARFKENTPELIKDKEVSFDSTKYKHAQLGNIVEKIAAGLSAVGISWRWETSQTGPTIRVTCILTHELGHSESNFLEAQPDSSGKKNSIQAVGSTVTYLQRYTLLAATGLATKDQDNDAVIPDMPEETYQNHLKAIRAAKTLSELHEVSNLAYKAAGRDQVTQKSIIQEKDKKKAELMGVKA